MSDLEVQQYLFDVQGQKLLFSEPADPHRHFPSLSALAAIGAAQSDKAIGEDAALQIGAQCPLNMKPSEIYRHGTWVLSQRVFVRRKPYARRVCTYIIQLGIRLTRARSLCGRSRERT